MENNKKNEERVKNLRRGGLSLSEANRLVYGWSDPKMKDILLEAMDMRPKEAPIFSQKEAFRIVLKAVYGAEFNEKKVLELPHQAYLEVVEVVARGILAGHVAKKTIKISDPTPEQVFHKARSEFKRLINTEFKNIKHTK